MKQTAAFLSTLVAAHLTVAPSAAIGASDTVASDDAQAGEPADNQGDNHAPLLSASIGEGRASPNHWVVRVEGSMVAMRDNWLSLPAPEVGLTVGRDLNRSWSLELTGSAREADNANRRSWSALAAARWVAIASANGRHGLTLAAGPFLQVNHVVHGTIPFAHAELAYVYRAPLGLTVLAGVGPNIALANSSYVAPPRTPCDNSGHAFVLCLDLGPNAQEIHVGDAVGQLRLALGWQF